MGYHQDGAVSLCEVVLQPGDCRYVQVVRRLVKQEQFRVLDKDLRKGDFLDHAAGKFPHLPREIADAEYAEDALDLSLVVPEVLAVHLGADLLVFGLHLCRHALLKGGAGSLIAAYRVQFGGVRAEDVRRNAVVCLEVYDLGQEGNACFPVYRYRAGIGGQDSGNRVQQGGLARSVPAD